MELIAKIHGEEPKEESTADCYCDSCGKNMVHRDPYFLFCGVSFSAQCNNDEKEEKGKEVPSREFFERQLGSTRWVRSTACAGSAVSWHSG